MKRKLILLNILVCLFVVSCSYEKTYSTIPDIAISTSNGESITVYNKGIIRKYGQVDVYLSSPITNYKTDDRIANINANAKDFSYKLNVKEKYKKITSHVEFLDSDYNPFVSDGTNDSSISYNSGKKYFFSAESDTPLSYDLNVTKRIVSYDFSIIPESILNDAKFAIVYILITYSEHNIFSYSFNSEFSYSDYLTK